jgi:hypothetical protein
LHVFTYGLLSNDAVVVLMAHDSLLCGVDRGDRQLLGGASEAPGPG